MMAFAAQPLPRDGRSRAPARGSNIKGGAVPL